MPKINKRVIATYVRSDCQRLLKLSLTPDTREYEAERRALGMPEKAVARPGMNVLTQEGAEWEQAKLADLLSTFGSVHVLGNHSKGGFQNQPLASALTSARPNTFIIRPEFKLGNTFKKAIGVDRYMDDVKLEFSSVIPDIIQVVTPGHFQRMVDASGTVHLVAPNDTRTGLRVIDVKLTAEASASYFAEITYYSLTLAGWLADNGWDDRFAVVDNAAIWPGSHDAAAIVKLQAEKAKIGTTPTIPELLNALDEDLESLEIEVFAPRLRHFFIDELERVVRTDWRDLDYHVNSSCSGCEYLGYVWGTNPPNPDHCYQMAGRERHLSTIPYLSRGARLALGDRKINTATDLGTLSAGDPAFDCHSSLRATRTVIASRVQALLTGTSVSPPDAGTSAIIPRWSDLSLHVSADFDLGSGITLSFGISGSRSWEDAGGEHFEPIKANAFINDQRSILTERRELLNLLTAIDAEMIKATNVNSNATMQVYVWDTVTYDHLIRVIGRHLTEIMAKKAFKKMAWLFPPEEVIGNSKIASNKSPITIVTNAIKAIVAAPIPHYYSLLGLARQYRPARVTSDFSIHPFFEDPLSDQIPSERAHEIWNKVGGSRPWSQQIVDLRQAVEVKLFALSAVVAKLREDLRSRLTSAAPKITDIRPPSMLQRVSADGQVWSAFALLNAQIVKLEHQITMAMPVHEREARFRSARLSGELGAPERGQAFLDLGLTPADNIRIYRMAASSREAKFEAGDFTCAVSPAGDAGFYQKRISTYLSTLPASAPSWVRPEHFTNILTSVSVLAIDRERLLIALEFNDGLHPAIRNLERHGLLNLASDVVLDSMPRDFLTEKVKKALKAIGNPSIAAAHGASTELALGKTAPKPQTAHHPVADILWDSVKLSTTASGRNASAIRPTVEAMGVSLNPSQWDAWTSAIENRLTLIWGPPGTGKSETLRAILRGLLVGAHLQGRPIRILITGGTYDAIDNLATRIFNQLNSMVPLIGSVRAARLRSGSRDASNPAFDMLNDSRSNPALGKLHAALSKITGSAIVTGTPQQVFKFAEMSASLTSPLFDVIVIDEASQMDMANASICLTAIAPEGCVIVAGDPKQLPPIHQAEPPAGLEKLVGSIYDYLRDHRGVTPAPLLTNYRSNSAIVSLGTAADYPAGLNANSPDMRLNLATPLPVTVPLHWPAGKLPFTAEYSRLLDPNRPVTAFIYPEARSSQWNEFEAETVTSLIWLLRHHADSVLLNEINRDGTVSSPQGKPHDGKSFWEHGVGIVTPHRAHKALVVSKLQQLFSPLGDDPNLVRGAVNTVEKFQGQERDVIIASYALGDTDAIKDEEEFLLSLNRFNVMASRPRAKLIVLASQEVINHLPGDIDVIRSSKMLKYFAETYCSTRESIELPFQENGKTVPRPGSYRWRA